MMGLITAALKEVLMGLVMLVLLVGAAHFLIVAKQVESVA